MGCVLRDAAPADLPAIVAIYNSAVPSGIATPELRPVSVASRRRWFAAHHPDVRPLWVIEVEGRVAAWLSFGATPVHGDAMRSAELSVYVHEDFREQGVGSHLVAAAIDRAPVLGLDALSAFVFERNASSLSLFRKFGFTLVARLPGVKERGGLVRDLVVLRRRLP